MWRWRASAGCWLLVTGTNFSVSSAVGFLALFGVSVQTGVIMLEYMNQLRARGRTIADSAIEGAVLSLRPIMMTMLVARLGLLRAALSHAIGSDSIRHRDRADCRLGDEYLSSAHAVCLGSWRSRRAAGGGVGCGGLKTGLYGNGRG